MFLLLGINSKVKDCGLAPAGTCPVCGKPGALRICKKYMTPHIFFIPTFHFGSEYIATCGACASVMGLAAPVGKAVENGRPVSIGPGDLEILQNNAVPVCPACGARQQRDSAFCNRCGSRL